MRLGVKLWVNLGVKQDLGRCRFLSKATGAQRDKFANLY